MTNQSIANDTSPWADRLMVDAIGVAELMARAQSEVDQADGG